VSFRRKRSRRALGEKKENRKAAELLSSARYRMGLIRPPAPRGWRDATGLKCQYVPGSTFEGGNGVLTPYFRKLKARRRAARRVAHESRRRNR
jgi:hypothetical protein